MYVISTLVELLIHTVTEYLEHNKRIVVPRLGAFIVKPGGETVVFSELMRNDDGVLRALMATKGLSELEIDGMIDRLIFNIRHAISNRKEYVIEGFGIFAAGANGTIRFTQNTTQNIVQGYIKPSIPLSDNARRRDAKSPITAINDKQSENAVKMSRSHLANPDPYLRGLKYDNHKKIEREGTVYVMSGVQQSRRRNMLIALVAAIAVICAVSYIFIRFHNNPPRQEVIFYDDGQIEEDSPEAITAGTDTELAEPDNEQALSETGQNEQTAPPIAGSDQNR